MARSGQRTITVQLTESAEAVVRGLRRDYGMTQSAAVERILQFVAEVDPRLRTAILSPHPEVRAACALHLLQQMAGQMPVPPEPPVVFEAVMDEILPGEARGGGGWEGPDDPSPKPSKKRTRKSRKPA